MLEIMSSREFSKQPDFRPRINRRCTLHICYRQNAFFPILWFFLFDFVGFSSISRIFHIHKAQLNSKISP